MCLSVKHKHITDKAKKGRSLFAYSVYTDMDGDLKIAARLRSLTRAFYPNCFLKNKVVYP